MFVNLSGRYTNIHFPFSLSFVCLKSFIINISIGKQVKASTETPKHQPATIVGVGDSSPGRTEAHSRPRVDVGVPLSPNLKKMAPLVQGPRCCSGWEESATGA